MNSWEKQLMKHILNEKYLGENECDQSFVRVC